MNILIVEDELHTANLLKEIIEESGDFLVVKIVESIVDAVDYLVKHQQNLHLLFFDIELSDGLSFEIFNHVDIITPVVFCTAYDEYAMKAIKNNGIDYILKPFRNEEINSALEKYKTLQANLNTKKLVEFNKPAPSFQQNFLSQFKDKTIVFKVDEIACFSIQNEVTYLHAFNGKKSPVYKKIEYIESVCDPKQFFRINRQMLVNRAAINSYQPYFNRKIILNISAKVDEKPIVSRLKVSEFKKWLEQ
ncbi:LytR/AlgR family response regulator transcription factor [Polaribacter sp. M15]